MRFETSDKRRQVVNLKNPPAQWAGGFLHFFCIFRKMRINKIFYFLRLHKLDVPISRRSKFIKQF